jgi:Zn-dependent protease/CBS domain-containing protein
MIGVPIARIGGIEIRVQLGWILVVALVAALAVLQVNGSVPSLPVAAQWALGAAVGVAFFVSAMLHDLAHALIARRRGVVVGSVLISFFGGTTPTDPASDVANDDLAIAAGGPIVSVAIGLLLGAVALGVGGISTELGQALGEIVAVLAALNLLMGFVNLIPAYPLDGGRIVRALAWRRTNSKARGWAVAATSGRVAGLVVVAAGTGLALLGEFANGGMVLLSGWFLVLSSRAIRDRLKIDALIADLSVADVMERDPATVHPGLTVDTVADSLLDGSSETTAIVVVDGTAIAGILGLGQVRRLRRGAWGTTHVGDAMVGPPRMAVVRSDQPLVTGVERLQRSGLDGIPVIDDDQLVGLLTRRSIAVAMRERAAAGALSDPGAQSGPGAPPAPGEPPDPGAPQ